MISFPSGDAARVSDDAHLTDPGPAPSGPVIAVGGENRGVARIVRFYDSAVPPEPGTVVGDNPATVRR